MRLSFTALVTGVFSSSSDGARVTSAPPLHIKWLGCLALVLAVAACSSSSSRRSREPANRRARTATAERRREQFTDCTSTCPGWAAVDGTFELEDPWTLNEGCTTVSTKTDACDGASNCSHSQVDAIRTTQGDFVGLYPTALERAPTRQRVHGDVHGSEFAMKNKQTDFVSDLSRRMPGRASCARRCSPSPKGAHCGCSSDPLRFGVRRATLFALESKGSSNPATPPRRASCRRLDVVNEEWDVALTQAGKQLVNARASMRAHGRVQATRLAPRKQSPRYCGLARRGVPCSFPVSRHCPTYRRVVSHSVALRQGGFDDPPCFSLVACD